MLLIPTSENKNLKISDTLRWCNIHIVFPQSVRMAADVKDRETPKHTEILLTFRHRASSIRGQAFRYSLENAFYIFNQQIYFII